MPDREKMGLDYGLEGMETSFKLKFRWLFTIDGFIGGTSGSSDSLPPMRGARPSLTFREQEVQHVNETVYFPMKPDWKPITLVLYDNKNNDNPIFNWIKDTMYNAESAGWAPSVSSKLKKKGLLELFDGCGKVCESWELENCYPSEVNWDELDMGTSELVTVSVTLRYDRAYVR